MIRLHEETCTRAIDVAQLRRSLPAWFEAIRRLDLTTDGVRSSHDDVRRASLRVTAGRHPCPGTAYRLTRAYVDPVDGVDTERVEDTDLAVLADDPTMVQVQLRGVDASDVLTVTFEPADAPTTCTIDLEGTVEVSIVVDLNQVPHGREPQVVATVLHRWATVEATVHVVPDPDGRDDGWRWTVRAEGRGRSVVRPIASFAWLFARRRAKAEIDRFLDDSLVQVVTMLNALLAEQTRDGASEETGARRTIDAWIEQLPMERPHRA